MNDFILHVLAVMAKYDSHDSLFWRTDGRYAPVTFFINCNDLFWWACADLEQITPDNIEILEQSFADAMKVCKAGYIYGTELFCCRVRKMRPQGCCYPDNSFKDDEYENLWPLFDACGPERAKDIGNPYAPGERKQRAEAAKKAKEGNGGLKE